jgi:5-methyltetrahydropteroyltriglutamate--homocysteine methyltransferase
MALVTRAVGTDAARRKSGRRIFPVPAAPLRFIRPGTVVVLGLISSKVPELESQDDLRRRIDEAARYVPLENLAISPQCGFASTSAGNVLTVDEEKRKLELVVEVARTVWG